MARIRLELSDSSAEIEVPACEDFIDEVIEQLIKPVLLGAGFAPETVALAFGEVEVDEDDEVDE